MEVRATAHHEESFRDVIHYSNDEEGGEARAAEIVDRMNREGRASKGDRRGAGRDGDSLPLPGPSRE